MFMNDGEKPECHAVFEEDLEKLENAFIEGLRIVVNVVQLESEDDPAVKRMGFEMLKCESMWYYGQD